MKYLITGSAGYIGSHIINRLIQQNEELVGLYHANKPKIHHESIHYIRTDIADSSFNDKLPDDIDVIIHCAALIKDFGPKSAFYNINVKGTNTLVKWASDHHVTQIIHLGHIPYETSHRFSYYSKTKNEIEKILHDHIKNNNMPITIIRPGNVFGPEAPVWLVRIISLILKNKLFLINQGEGIFHHTYIENLIDAILLSIGNKNAIGTSFDITDGDDSITFQQYFTDIADILGKSNNFRSISKKTALWLGTIMLFFHKIARVKPIITPLAAEILTNQKRISIKKAQDQLHYHPKITYKEAMGEIERWIKKSYDFA